jgi:hypothetical protein
VTLGRMPREEPSAGCSGRAGSHTPLGSGSEIFVKDGTSATARRGKMTNF